MAPSSYVRDQAEVERSASEASKVVLAPIDVERYLNPPPESPFPLEYAFHLLGDVRGKSVLDLGCGSGESVVILAHLGAKVLGIDISPDLIAIAEQRLREGRSGATVRVGSAYETGLEDASVDIIFCMSLIHHLDIPHVKHEMHRILRPGGCIVLKEPIRFSRTYAILRSLLPAREDISDYEHPLTWEELHKFQEGFAVDGVRFFRLPFVPLLQRSLHAGRRANQVSSWILKHFPVTAHFATVVALRLRKVSRTPAPESGRLAMEA